MPGVRIQTWRGSGWAPMVACLTMGVMTLTGCGSSDDAPPVASVAVSVSKAAAALGSPVDMDFRFEVAPGMTFDGDYRVFVHLLDADGVSRWSDDHDPPVRTSEWKPGQVVEYTRTSFLPVVPYLGDATIRVGLYRADAQDTRAPLSGPEPEARSYKVAGIRLLPQSENVFVVVRSGAHPSEFAPEDPAREWFWTKREFVASFKNPKKDSTLYLEFDGRPDLFDQPQTVSVYLGSETVATFPADSVNPMLRRIPLRADQLGATEMAELRVAVDHSFVPANVPRGGQDSRELGIRIYRLFVDPS